MEGLEITTTESKPVESKPGKLTAQQVTFAQEYIVDLDGKNAAIRAGYSEETAASQASRLLTNVNIKKLIEQKMLEKARRTNLTADGIIKELLNIATFDIREMFGPDGQVLPIAEMPDSIARCITQFEIEDIIAGQADDRRVIGTTKKIKLADKTKALQLLGQHLRMFVNKIEVEVTDSLAERLKQARERAHAHARTIELESIEKLEQSQQPEHE